MNKFVTTLLLVAVSANVAFADTLIDADQQGRDDHYAETDKSQKDTDGFIWLGEEASRINDATDVANPISQLDDALGDVDFGTYGNSHDGKDYGPGESTVPVSKNTVNYAKDVPETTCGLNNKWYTFQNGHYGWFCR